MYILSVDNADKCFMASFDVESPFTNVPLRETIDICLGSLFVDPIAVQSLGLVRHFLEL